MSHGKQQHICYKYGNASKKYPQNIKNNLSGRCHQIVKYLTLKFLVTKTHVISNIERIKWLNLTTILVTKKRQ